MWRDRRSRAAKFRARVRVAKYADQRADILADRLQWLTCGEPEGGEAETTRLTSVALTPALSCYRCAIN